MKTLVLSTCLLLGSFWALALPVDSLIVRFGNKGRIAIYAPTKDQMKGITKYDLNRIVKDMVTKLDSVPEGQVYAIDVPDGKQYLRDTIAVVRKRRGSITVTINNDDAYKSTRVGNAADTTYEGEKQVVTKRREANDNRNNWRVSTDFHFGLNTWLGGPGLQTYGGNSYELSPLGSRYFAISTTQNPTLVKTSRFKLGIRYGLQVAWNNFMFQEDVRLERGSDNIKISPYPTPLDKSKLTICNLEVPFVPQFSFYNSSRRRAFNIGIGGFVGYRIDSYTKVKQGDGAKFWDHNNFYINNFQYGLQGTVGLAKFNFFVKYNLNNTFQDNRGPAVRPLSFGITI